MSGFKLIQPIKIIIRTQSCSSWTQSHTFPMFVVFEIDCEDIARDNWLVEFFLNNTNLTFLAFLYKIDIERFQNQQK